MGAFQGKVTVDVSGGSIPKSVAVWPALFEYQDCCVNMLGIIVWCDGTTCLGVFLISQRNLGYLHSVPV